MTANDNRITHGPWRNTMMDRDDDFEQGYRQGYSEAVTACAQKVFAALTYLPLGHKLNERNIYDIHNAILDLVPKRGR